jgi:hypothetical protein
MRKFTGVGECTNTIGMKGEVQRGVSDSHRVRDRIQIDPEIFGTDADESTDSKHRYLAVGDQSINLSHGNAQSLRDIRTTHHVVYCLLLASPVNTFLPTHHFWPRSPLSVGAQAAEQGRQHGDELRLESSAP